jgi:hypothetical protein
MRDILLQHAERYPLWDIADLYKLVHQGAMGNEHAVADETAARAWLLRELETMRSSPEGHCPVGHCPSEPLLDSISADGSIVRVHLRPYVRLGLDAETLLGAFLHTAREFRGSTESIEVGFAEAAGLARDGLLAFGVADVRSLLARMRAAGFPAIHHSAVFEAAYHPAYRVVARAFLPWELLAAVLGPMTGLRSEVSNERAARGGCSDCSARGSGCAR